jgi:hypothetical protein
MLIGRYPAAIFHCPRQMDWSTFPKKQPRYFGQQNKPISNQKRVKMAIKGEFEPFSDEAIKAREKIAECMIVMAKIAYGTHKDRFDAIGESLLYASDIYQLPS